MPFDEEEIDVHGACAAEINTLKNALRALLRDVADLPDLAKEYCHGSTSKATMVLGPCDDCSSFDFSCTGKCLEQK